MFNIVDWLYFLLALVLSVILTWLYFGVTFFEKDLLSLLRYRDAETNFNPFSKELLAMYKVGDPTAYLFREDYLLIGPISFLPLIPVVFYLLGFPVYQAIIIGAIELFVVLLANRFCGCAPVKFKSIQPWNLSKFYRFNKYWLGEVLSEFRSHSRFDTPFSWSEGSSADNDSVNFSIISIVKLASALRGFSWLPITAFIILFFIILPRMSV